MAELTVGSVFSGVGGLDLGLERTGGFKIIWQSEIDHYCCQVLRRHWPDIPNHGNAVLIDWDNVEPPDLICGGYPCQPFSTAGKRNGTSDLRHLWPFLAEGIRRLRPRYVLLENVLGHLSLGFGEVIGEMAVLGYDTRWDCVSAYSVGSPQHRERVFIVGVRRPDLSDTDGSGSKSRSWTEFFARRIAQPDQYGWWAVEPGVGRVADGIPNRLDRIRALGNAVVPQVAEHIGRSILELEDKWTSLNG